MPNLYGHNLFLCKGRTGEKILRKEECPKLSKIAHLQLVRSASKLASCIFLG